MNYLLLLSVFMTGNTEVFVISPIEISSSFGKLSNSEIEQVNRELPDRLQLEGATVIPWSETRKIASDAYDNSNYPTCENKECKKAILDHTKATHLITSSISCVSKDCLMRFLTYEKDRFLIQPVNKYSIELSIDKSVLGIKKGINEFAYNIRNTKEIKKKKTIVKTIRWVAGGLLVGAISSIVVSNINFDHRKNYSRRYNMYPLGYTLGGLGIGVLSISFVF